MIEWRVYLVPNIFHFLPQKLGLQEALDDPDCPVGSIYWKDYADKFNRLAANIKSGKVIFTEP